MEVTAEEKTVHEVNDGDYVQYLIVSNHHHPLSNSIMSAISRVQFRRVDNVTIQDICAADLVLIVDYGLEEVEFSNLNKKLAHKQGQFRLAICLHPDHINRWYTGVDSVFLTKGDTEQRRIINGLIESIELQGLICVDFADIYSVFCNMQQSFFYQGISEGKWRVIGAIDEAIEKRSFDCKTAMIILYSGLDFTLDEFEMAVNYFSTKITEDVCCVFAHRLDPDRLYAGKFEVMIFINE